MSKVVCARSGKLIAVLDGLPDDLMIHTLPLRHHFHGRLELLPVDTSKTFRHHSGKDVVHIGVR